MLSEAIVQTLNKLNIALYADSGSIEELAQWSQWPVFKGVTSNPSLLKKAGEQDYCAFAKKIINVWGDQPISFGTVSDDFGKILIEARTISSWASNVYVKVPVLNSAGEMAYEVIQQLLEEGIKVNVTCLMDMSHLEKLISVLPINANAYLSIFAGRIADTGRSASDVIKQAKQMTYDHPNVKLLWASTRELYNIFEAEQAGCDIITLNKDVVKKLPLIGKDLSDFSLETVNIFHQDAAAAGYHISY